MEVWRVATYIKTVYSSPDNTRIGITTFVYFEYQPTTIHWYQFKINLICQYTTCICIDRLGPRPKLKAKTWAKAYHYICIKTPPTTHHHRNFSEGSWHRRRLGFGISILQDQNKGIQPPLSPLLVNPFVYERTHDHLELFKSNLNQTLKERTIPKRYTKDQADH